MTDNKTAVLGFAGIVFLLLILGAAAMFNLIRLADISVNIYRHPFVVSNAARTINTNISSVRRYMQDVLVSEDEVQRDFALMEIDNHSEAVHQEFTLIFERYLGDKSDVQQAYKEFVDWEVIRGDVVLLVKTGKLLEANDVIKGKSARHLAMLNESMENMIRFAENKATEFRLSALSVKKNALATVFALSLICIIASIAISRYVIRNLINQQKAVESAHEAIVLAEKRAALLLEEKVVLRTHELVRVNEDLKTFTYIVSHDLRAPLLNIKGFAGELKRQLQIVQSILSDCLPGLDETRKQQVEVSNDKIPLFLGFVDKAADRMEALIGAILKLSRLGQRALVVQAITTNNLVNTILETFSHQIKNKGILVTVHPLPNMQADPVAMEQIFGNILTNAINYMDPDRAGKIEVSGETGEDGKLIYHIKDNGRGIAEEEMHKVFEIFRRAGKETVPGEGMGMAYVKTLVQKYGGEITCQSQPGEGSTFSFSIPADRALNTL